MSSLSVSLCSLVMAFCGLIYELTIAQSLSILAGNSVVQYSLTIGLFLISMGAGAMIPQPQGSRGRLAKIQLALSFVAPIGLAGLWLTGIFFGKFILFLIAILTAGGIGLLTGMELPLLLQIAGRGNRLAVIGFDHFGMLLACLLFPLAMLPYQGVFASLFLAAILNAGAAACLSGERRIRWLSGAAIALLILAIQFEAPLRHWLSERFLA